MYKVAILVASVIVFGAGATPLNATPNQPGKLPESTSCLQVSDHIFEVCTAYFANCSFAALVPYYKYGRSANTARVIEARNRLESRYTGVARKIIESRVNAWPKGETDVSLPKISLVSVTSSLATNKASIVTRETWTVKSHKSGRTIYKEVNRLHRTTMQRVQGLLLHKWVVTAIR